MPFMLSIGAYNEAGELVKIIFNGTAQTLPFQLGIAATAYSTGGGGMLIGLPGLLTQNGIQTSGGAVWDLSNSNAQYVDSGIYYIKAEYVDSFGKTTALTQAVQVINADRENTLVIYNSSGEQVRRMVLNGSYPNGVTDIGIASGEQVFAPVYDSNGALVSNKLKINGRDSLGNPSLIEWDGLSDEGMPVDGGTYQVQMIYRSKDGQSTVVTRSVTVIKTADSITLAGSRIGPNPLMGQAKTLYVSYPPSLGHSCVARVYNLAGELVALGTDPMGAGKFEISVGRLSSGVYLVKLEKMSGYVMKARTVIKIAVAK